jgi:putative transposase
MLQPVLQELLESEMTACLGAARYERGVGRRGYRSGSYPRQLLTRVGLFELRVPQDREGRFSTELFERYGRSEKAFTALLVDAYTQGVATRRMKHLTEELCGCEVSASTVSRVMAKLDSQLTAFAERPLVTECYPYLMLDARYERVREGGTVHSRAVQVALGIDATGQRRILAVELAQRESAASWETFLTKLKARGLHGVQFVVSDAHEGLQRAIGRLLPAAIWQRCYVHFLRNALDYLPRKHPDDALTELRWLYDRRNADEARRDLACWLERWQSKHPKLCDWVEANIDATLNFYVLPHAHHKHLKSTNLLERLNQELKRRTLLVRIFPHEASCLRLTRALAVEIDEAWQEGARYLDMTLPGASAPVHDLLPPTPAPHLGGAHPQGPPPTAVSSTGPGQRAACSAAATS